MEAAPARASRGPAPSGATGSEAVARPKPADATAAAADANATKPAAGKPVTAAARVKPGSVFDAPVEPFELRPPNEVAPTSVASAVASALHARPRPVPFVAPEPAKNGDKPAAPAETPKSQGKAPENRHDAGAAVEKSPEPGPARETPGAQAPRPRSDS